MLILKLIRHVGVPSRYRMRSMKLLGMHHFFVSTLSFTNFAIRCAQFSPHFRAAGSTGNGGSASALELRLENVITLDHLSISPRKNCSDGNAERDSTKWQGMCLDGSVSFVSRSRPVQERAGSVPRANCPNYPSRRTEATHALFAACATRYCSKFASAIDKFTISSFLFGYGDFVRHGISCLREGPLAVC